MSDNLKIKAILEEFKQAIKRLYKNRLKNIILYGSFARGEERKESDIDLLIIIKGHINPFKEIKKIVDVTYDIGLNHNTLLSVYPISEERYSSLSTTFLSNVKEDGILI